MISWGWVCRKLWLSSDPTVPLTNRLCTNLLTLLSLQRGQWCPHFTEEETADRKLCMFSPRQINGRSRIQTHIFLVPKPYVRSRDYIKLWQALRKPETLDQILSFQDCQGRVDRPWSWSQTRLLSPQEQPLVSLLASLYALGVGGAAPFVPLLTKSK